MKYSQAWDLNVSLCASENVHTFDGSFFGDLHIDAAIGAISDFRFVKESLWQWDSEFTSVQNASDTIEDGLIDICSVQWAASLRTFIH